ncbi:MAG: ATP-binding protein [Clostridiales bacterium]|nr:ATP-binding protein [Clostridiales bacterium]
MDRKRIFGDVSKIGLGVDFKETRQKNYFYVDKTSFIERYLSDAARVSLICRPRRFGKSLNMDALRCFLTDSEDSRELFRGLAVESSCVWDKASSAPVFHFDFKGLAADSYRYTVFVMVRQYLRQYCQLISDPDVRERADEYLAERSDEGDALRLLTEVAHKATGKKSYILIDEYDKLLLDGAGSESYAETRAFLTYLFSAAFKDNPFLEKGLLTGVMRISYEGLFSGLNNISVYDVFNDELYSEDFGITDEEMLEICELRAIDGTRAKEWYNGFSIHGTKLYNIFSVVNYLKRGQLDRYWGNSGTMGIVANAIHSGAAGAPARGVSGGPGDAAGAGRLNTLARIVSGEQAAVPVAQLSSLAQINADDASLYSLLIQAGYLAIVESSFNRAVVCVPNQEMRVIWKDFIFNAAMPNCGQPMIDLFLERDSERFAAALEHIMSYALSYWDLGGNLEQVYHIFLLGGLVFSDPLFDKAKTKSNREAGDGRYDIWIERNGKNYIFELKKCGSAAEAEMEAMAEHALAQIDEKRYGAELDGSKPIWKVGIACFGKQCKVKCAVRSA